MTDDRKPKDFWSSRLGRRQILKTLGAAGAVIALNGPQGLARALADHRTLSGSSESGPDHSEGTVPRRLLGKTGVEVSALCFGGAHLGRIDGEAEAMRVLHEAIDAGITFMDNAWEYNRGISEERMGKGLQGRRQQVFLMTKVCSHGRDKKVAMQQLEESLRRLRTDYLDLWQIHEVIYENDPDRHFAPGGAAEALLDAKREGKVRFIGFTGHKDPKIHLKMLAQDFPFDACQLPLNVFDGTHRSFEQEVLPVLNRRGIAPLAMKSLSGTADAVKQGLVTAEEALRYVLSLPVATVVSGIDSHAVLRQNLAVARRFTPMTVAEMQALRTRMAPYARAGTYEPFKFSDRFDGRIGREQQTLS
ncbi:MAG: Oxidoreductase, aldo/keto reductase family [Nitrospira sp.]|nr:MAG: Oxidoreductase, aldo/keto reductase family [Nitrospira sp.]